MEGVKQSVEGHAIIMGQSIRDTGARLGEDLKRSANYHGMWVGGLTCVGMISGAVIPLLKLKK